MLITVVIRNEKVCPNSWLIMWYETMIADSIAWKHLLFRLSQTSQTVNIFMDMQCFQKLSFRTVTRSLWPSLFSHAGKNSKEKYQMNFADLQRKKPWGEKAFSKLSLNPLYSSVHLSSLNKCCWMQTKHNHPHDNSFWWSFIAMCHFQVFLSHMNPLHPSQVQWFTLLNCIWLTVNKNVSMQILNFLLLIPFGCNHRVNEIKVKRSLLEV